MSPAEYMYDSIPVVIGSGLQASTAKDSAAQFFVHALIVWAAAGNLRDFPWRGVRDSYRVLITEILLRRTRAENVVATYHKFFERLPDLESFGLADRAVIQQLVASLGLAWRSQNLVDLQPHLLALKRVPQTYDELVALPGVGNYVASAVLSLTSGVPMPLVDTNSVRLMGRYFGFPVGPETRRRAWLLRWANYLVPAQSYELYNYATLDLPAAICRPAKPLCKTCCLESRCTFANAGGIPR